MTHPTPQPGTQDAGAIIDRINELGAATMSAEVHHADDDTTAPDDGYPVIPETFAEACDLDSEKWEDALDAFSADDLGDAADAILSLGRRLPKPVSRVTPNGTYNVFAPDLPVVLTADEYAGLFNAAKALRAKLDRAFERVD